jgi:hypothetical protein
MPGNSAALLKLRLITLRWDRFLRRAPRNPDPVVGVGFAKGDTRDDGSAHREHWRDYARASGWK